MSVTVDFQTILVDFSMIREAMRRWETDRIEGRTRSHDEADSLPPDQKVDELAETLWRLLGEIADAPGGR